MAGHYSNFIEEKRTALKKYIKNNNLKSLVIGISGGIDSTVSAALASEVCKEVGIPLIGRCLITNTNKNEEIEAARQVGNAFCSDFKEINITHDIELIAGHFETTEGKMSKLQKGNIKARYRMMYLYHTASMNGGVVIDNDNFTEFNLGFFTIHGDQGDINLGLHTLWKTEVYELAKELCEKYCNAYIDSKNNPESDIEITDQWFNKYEALLHSIGLIPTDGNGVSNSDCEQFGLENYGQVDDVLRHIYFGDIQTPNILSELEEKYNKDGINKIINLHEKTDYKRNVSPLNL